MSRENFKEEFQKLVCQFTASPKDESDPSPTSLTKQEIFDSVQEILELKLDVTLVDSTRDDVRTPIAGIVTTTPDAPDIPKITLKQSGDIQERSQSFGSLVTEFRTSSSNSQQLSLPNLDLLTANVEENNNDLKIDVPDGHFAEGKEGEPKSNTSAASCKLVRSDTFVCEDDFQSVKNGDVFEEKKFEPIATEFGGDNSLAGANLINIFMKLKTFKDCAIDLIDKIDDIQKVVPANVRPIRRLSSIGCYTGLNRASKLTRRSMGAFPGTPTSSRLSPGTPGSKDSAPVRSKSRSTTSLVVNNNNGGSKLSLPPTYRSVSSGALVLPKNLSLPQKTQSSSIKTPKTLGLRSPSTSLLNISDKSVNRQPVNQKYSHVQSTIPKPKSALGKRKAN